jgi:hypothetical protein
MNEMDELALEELEHKRENTYGNIKFLGFVSILAFAMAFIAYVSDRTSSGDRLGFFGFGLLWDLG